ncbi:MAG: hypothetical protein JSS75_06275 [Bacteroidetes bacterium]|nr:hypothetical protein [Bacteroidota bacterium]
MLIVSALMMLGLLLFYPILGSDGWIHLNWLRQFGDLFAEGHWYPRWMPDSFAGFGSPAFYYYPPLPYWVGGIVSLIGVATEANRFTVVSVLFLLVSSISSYLLLRAVSSSRMAAGFGALFYCVFPYRCADLFLRNALGEHAAFAFVPIVLLSLYTLQHGNTDRQSMLRAALWSAIGWSGLLLSNVPATIVLLYVTLIYWIVGKVWVGERRWLLLSQIAGMLLALAVSAVYVMPVSDLKDAISTQAMGGVNLAIEANHSTGYALLDSMVSQKIKTLYVLLDALLIVTIGFVYVRRSTLRDTLNSFDRATQFALIVAIAVQVPYVLYPIWKILPFMDIVQFTWRWDVWITMGLSILIVRIFESKMNMQFAAVGVVLMLVLSAGALWIFSRNATDQSIGFAPIADATMDAPEYLPEVVADKPEAAMRFFAKHTNDREIRITRGSTSIGRIERGATTTTFEVDQTSASADLLFDHAYFPTWHLKDDRGVEYPVRSDSLGRIVATITEGKRSYQLRIVKQNSERVGAWISAFGLIALVGLGAATALSRRRAASSPSPATTTLHSTEAEARYPKSGS